MGKALILAGALALAACTTAPRATEDPRQVWCSQNNPLRPSQAVYDAMSRAEIDSLLEHNRRGVQWCGWRP